jgi:small subunit ribosomal protein S20
VPKIKSAIKRVDIAKRNSLKNQSWKSAVRTVRTKVQDTAAANNMEKAAELLKNAYKTIDQAVSKGVLHRNSAARKKSKLAKVLAKKKAV